MCLCPHRMCGCGCVLFGVLCERACAHVCACVLCVMCVDLSHSNRCCCCRVISPLWCTCSLCDAVLQYCCRVLRAHPSGWKTSTRTSVWDEPHLPSAILLPLPDTTTSGPTNTHGAGTEPDTSLGSGPVDEVVATLAARTVAATAQAVPARVRAWYLHVDRGGIKFVDDYFERHISPHMFEAEMREVERAPAARAWDAECVVVCS